MKQTYRGYLGLDWHGKDKSVLNLGENEMKKESDIPAPRLRWVNEDNALFYEIDENEGKGKRPYWVDRNDIRVKEPRSLIHKKTFIAEEVSNSKKAKKAQENLLEDPSKVEKEYKVVEISSLSSLLQKDWNMLIKGDNLLALNALVKLFQNLPDEKKVKCIYIDPPYNTGTAFKHYDDNLEHSQWLTMMRDRLVLLRKLLREDGSIWINLDDNESHYMKILCDEVFGKENFITNIIWEKIYTLKNSSKYFSEMHDHILIYSFSKENWQRNLTPRTKELDETYTNPDNDPRGPWTTNAIQARNFYSEGSYEIVSPKGVVYKPPQGTYWRISKESFERLSKDKRIWWGKDFDNVPRIKKFLSEAKDGVVPGTIWFHSDVGQNAEAKIESRQFIDSDDIFPTPKPERLIQRILHIATNPEDLVLDCFAGSGTTLAVAHKMGRKWIGVEVGDHADTHIIPRLKKVISGEDQGGISKVVEWKGGGEFSYYHLGESIISIKGKTYDFNWNLEPEEIANSVLYYFDYKELETHESAPLPKNFYFGKNTKDDFAIVHIRNPEKEKNFNLTELELSKAIEVCKKKNKQSKITLFTNCGVQAAKDIQIVKVPTEILVEIE